MTFDLRSSELQHSFIKERICNVEKHFHELSSKLSIYNKKQAHVRDSGTDLAKCIEKFGTTETLNSSLRRSLMHFSDMLRAIQEFRDTEVQRTDAKVVLEFKNYDVTCKKAKADLKRAFEIRTKEVSKKNQLEKTRAKNPTNWQKISQAERTLNEAKNEATRTMLDLSKTIDNFERQKLEDLKHVFLEWIKIELMFHAKAIELYTSSYNIIKGIHVGEDLQEFRDHFKSYSPPSDSDLFQSADFKAVATQSAENPAPPCTPPNPAEASCSSIKSSVAATNSSLGTPSSIFKGVMSRKHRRTHKSDDIDKSDPLRGGDGNASVVNAVGSKFDFGDHCL